MIKFLGLFIVLIFFVDITSSKVRNLSKFRLPQPQNIKVSCPCSKDSLCKPVQKIPDKEIFGFSESTEWKDFPFDLITSVAWIPYSKDLLCTAHLNNVRLIAGAPDDIPLTDNTTERQIWIQKVVQSLQENFYDGVTFDYESTIAPGDPKAQWYVDIVNETNRALKAIDQGYQVSACVPWSTGLPTGIDNRAYDFLGLSQVTDFLYVMQYDSRSQIMYQCIASANCPLPASIRGIQEYIDLGVPASKLVMGVPWYGYQYPCINMKTPQDDFCSLKLKPFRKVNCSDAAGVELTYQVIRDIVHNNLNVTPVTYDYYMNAPHFNYIQDGNVYQIWYDDPVSLIPKYQYAKSMNLRGVGPFEFGYLDKNYADEYKQMWDALKVFVSTEYDCKSDQDLHLAIK